MARDLLEKVAKQLDEDDEALGGVTPLARALKKLRALPPVPITRQPLPQQFLPQVLPLQVAPTTQPEVKRPTVKGVMEQAGIPTPTELISTPFKFLEQWGKGAAATLLSPFYKRGEVPAVTTMRDPLEAFLPEGEVRKAYEEWQAPKFVKGTTEFAAELPFWMAIPGGWTVKGLKTAVTGLPAIGKYLGATLRPVAWVEAGITEQIPRLIGLGMKKAITAGETGAITLARKLATPTQIRKVGAKMLPEARALKQVFETQFKLSPNEVLLGREPTAHIARLPNDAYMVKQRALDTLGGLKYASMTEPSIRRVGIKIEKGLVTFNKDIQPRVEGASKAINDIIEHTGNYKLSPRIRHFFNALQNSLKDFNRLADAEGIPIVRTIEDYFPRHVLEKEGIKLSRPSGYLTGLGSLLQKRRFWQIQQEGIEQSGLKYVEDPILNLSLAWDGLMQRIATKRAVSVLQPLMKPTKTEAVRAKSLYDTVKAIFEERRIDARKLKVIQKQFPEFYERIQGALKPAGAPPIITGEGIDFLRQEIAGVEKYLSTEPIPKLIVLAKKITNLNYLDNKAKELGYPNGEALKESIERALEQTRTLGTLRAKLASAEVPIIPKAPVAPKITAPTYKVLGRTPSGEANLVTTEEGVLLERIATGKQKGWWKTIIGETEYVAQTRERVLEIAKERGAILPKVKAITPELAIPKAEALPKPGAEVTKPTLIFSEGISEATKTRIQGLVDKLPFSLDSIGLGGFTRGAVGREADADVMRGIIKLSTGEVPDSTILHEIGHFYAFTNPAKLKEFLTITGHKPKLWQEEEYFSNRFAQYFGHVPGLSPMPKNIQSFFDSLMAKKGTIGVAIPKAPVIPEVTTKGLTDKGKQELQVILGDAESLWIEKGTPYEAGLKVREDAARLLIQARRTVSHIKKSLGGMDVTESIGYDLAKALPAEQNEILSKVQQALIAGREPARTTLEAQLKVAESALQKAQLTAAKGKVTAQHMIDAASQGLGEARVNLAGFGNKVFRNVSTFDKNGKEIIITGQEITRRITNKFGERVFPLLKGTSNAASVLRITKASMDDSFLTIQFLMHQYRHPVATGKALYGSLVTLLADRNYVYKVLQKPENMSFILDYIYNRGLIRTPEYTEAAGLLSRGALKIPQIGKYINMITDQTFGRGNDTWMAAKVLGVLNVGKGMAPWAKANNAMGDLALFLNRSTGDFSLGGMGIGAQMRALLNSFVFFAPRFTFATGSIIADLPRAVMYMIPKGFWMMGGKTAAERVAGRALAKAGATRAIWSLEHLGSLYLGGTLLYIAACKAAGQEPKLDLRPKSAGGDGADAYSLQIGDHKVRMAGGMYNIVRSIIAISCSALEGDLVGVIEDIVRSYRSRSSPLTSFFWDIAEGRDFIGEATRESWEGFGKYTGMRVTPMWVESVIDAAQKGEKPGALAVIAAGEFFGGSTFPESEWDKVKGLQQYYVKQLLNGGLELKESFPTEYQQIQIAQNGGLKWADLNRGQQDEIRRLYPELVEQELTARNKSLELFGDDAEIGMAKTQESVIKERTEKMQGIGSAFLFGQMSPDEYFSQRSYIRPYYSGGMAVLWRFREEMGLTDEEARQKAQQKWTQEDKVLSVYLEMKGQPEIDPTTNTPNWDTTYARLETYLTQQTPEIQKYIKAHENDWIETLTPLSQLIEREFSSDMDFIRKIHYWEKETTEARKGIRYSSFETDAALAFWGYTGTVLTDIAYQLVIAKTNRMYRPKYSIPAVVNWEVKQQNIRQKPVSEPPEALPPPSYEALESGKKKLAELGSKK